MKQINKKNNDGDVLRAVIISLVIFTFLLAMYFAYQPDQEDYESCIKEFEDYYRASAFHLKFGGMNEEVEKNFVEVSNANLNIKLKYCEGLDR